MTYHVYAGKSSKKKIKKKLEEDFDDLNYNIDQSEDSDLVT